MIELLVVIGIIAVLMSLLMPAFRSARVSSQRIKCASNMRQIGLAMIAYAGANKGCWPLKDNVNPVPPAVGGASSYLYFWNRISLVEPLKEYGADVYVLTCPSSELIFNPPHVWSAAVPDSIGVHYAYMARFGDPRTLGCGSWYDNPPSAAPPKVKNGKGLILADLNMYFANGDNGLIQGYSGPNVKWMFSNHATGNRIDLAQGECRKFIRGSNRCYADGHIEWVHPDMMGQNDGPIGATADTGHYDDNLGGGYNGGPMLPAPNGLRPYFW